MASGRIPRQGRRKWIDYQSGRLMRQNPKTSVVENLEEQLAYTGTWRMIWMIIALSLLGLITLWPDGAVHLGRGGRSGQQEQR
jgi:hypothetical protein